MFSEKKIQIFGHNTSFFRLSLKDIEMKKDFQFWIKSNT